MKNLYQTIMENINNSYELKRLNEELNFDGNDNDCEDCIGGEAADLWEKIVEDDIATEEEIEFVCNVIKQITGKNPYTIDVMQAIIDQKSVSGQKPMFF